MGARHPGHSSERVAAARRDGVGRTVETKSGAAPRLYDAPKLKKKKIKGKQGGAMGFGATPQLYDRPPQRGEKKTKGKAGRGSGAVGSS
mmetsp:Transcript_43911/g.70579  ORF Transcript_43911/g.70579 Transcript_43911/m.70579 type:complete len:89 (-) Transcript_43911:330-596(-)